MQKKRASDKDLPVFDPCLYLFLDLQDFVHASEDQLCVDTPTSEDLIDDEGKYKNK